MRAHHHAIVTIVCMLVLMTMGSVVHATGSSLGCPDWPLCHGSFFPAMVNGVQFEHTHRLMAAGVVVLTATLLLRTLRGEAVVARGLLVVACALIVIQAVLGGLTVIYRLPPVISIAHLATSMALLSVLVVAAVRLTPRAPGVGAPAGPLFAAAAAIAYVQIVLGAAVRHTGAALACLGIPLCNGQVWPAFGLSQLHVVHRCIGILVLLVTCAAAVTALRRGATGARRAGAVIPTVAALVQVSLGVAVVLGYASLERVTLHHLGGALLLGSLVTAWALERPVPARAGTGVPAVSAPLSLDAAPD